MLVCSLDNRFEELVNTDSRIYNRFYPSTKVPLFDGGRGLIAALQHQYDIIHLFCDVLADGTLAHSGVNPLTGTELLEHCCSSNVKLLWIANDNPPDRYIKAFNARKKHINLVMTINRNGLKF